MRKPPPNLAKHKSAILVNSNNAMNISDTEGRIATDSIKPDNKLYSNHELRKKELKSHINNTKTSLKTKTTKVTNVPEFNNSTPFNSKIEYDKDNTLTNTGITKRRPEHHQLIQIIHFKRLLLYLKKHSSKTKKYNPQKQNL